MQKEINVLDLFSGIGGFTRGIEQAGFKIKNHFHSEIDRYANAIYSYHYPNAVQLGSVSDVRGKDLPRINLITFGFPCQDLSIAGKRAGLEGCRSGLFFEAMRLVENAVRDLTTRKEPLKSIISSLFSTENSERKLITLSCFAILAIAGFIPEKTSAKDTSTITFLSKFGWTKFGVNGPVSDSQRYKCLGNSVTTNVITAIMSRIKDLL